MLVIYLNFSSVLMDTLSAQLLLHRLNELCIHVPWCEDTGDATVRLVGQRDVNVAVEVNGAPLRPATSYQLIPGSTVRIVCWCASATVIVEGSKQLLQNIYRTAVSPTAQAVAEYNCLLHEDRAHGVAPRVLVLGRNETGKLDIAVTLVNYASRFGWSPFFVDLDPSERQSVSLPGSVGVARVENPIFFDEDVASSHLTTHFFTGTMSAQRFNRCYHNDESVNAVWLHFAKTASDVVHKAKASNSSGAIILAPYLTGSDGVRAVCELIDYAKITHVIVAHDDDIHDRLCSVFHESSDSQRSPTLPNLFQTKSGTPFRVDKLAGASANLTVSSRSRAIKTLQWRLQSFFHGYGLGRINPFVYDKLSLSSTSLFRWVSKDGKPSAVLVERAHLDGVVNCLAAIVDPLQARKDMGGLLASCVCGFARIQSVDGQELSLLTNLPKAAIPFSRFTLIIGDVQMLS